LPAVDLTNNFAGLNDMPADDRQREYRRDMLLASALIVAGLAISALALTAISSRDSQQIAQATPPTQSTPGAETKPSAPAEKPPAEPGTTGQRPSDIPPQPARPDPDAQKAGAQPALPPAPAEKVAPPIRER
jgi:hypothetical protein